MKYQGHEYKLLVTLLCTYSLHNLFKYLYIYSLTHFSVLFMYNARTKPYTYMWTYTSSVEFVYEKLIETKRIELKRNHKRKMKEMKKRNL